MAGRSRSSLVLDGPAALRPRVARRWLADRCEAAGLAVDGIDLGLLVSELVTNAVVHARGPMRIRLDVDDDRVRVELEDGSAQLPQVRHTDGDTPGGRGMRIVESLSRSWGAATTAEGKVVWAEVAVPEAGPGHPATAPRAGDRRRATGWDVVLDGGWDRRSDQVAEWAAAVALQRSLLPDRLPPVRGLELAAHLLPGEGGVGGDWYDVFELPGDRVGIVMGDVVGRGIGAAVVMGRLRSALRAYAIEADDPAEVLERLDRKAHHFEAGQMATVLYAVSCPARERLWLSSAGHLLPVLAPADGPAAPIEAVVDPPLAVVEGSRRHRAEVDLPPGAVLFLFTDGLVERRGTPIGERLDALCRAVAPDAPAEVCRAVLAAMLDDGHAPDDVAALALRRTP